MPTWLIWLPVGMGSLILLLGIPLIMQKIKPNNYYGFRTKKTLSDEEVWYTANSFAGKMMVIIGFIATLLSIGFMILLKNGNLTLSKDNAALIVLGLLLIPVLILTIACVLKIRKL